jgi:hypothetical protein
VSRTSNPFPAYPVASLSPPIGDEDSLTVATAGIVKAKELVDSYLARFDGSERPRGVNASVAGVFGTGKTHLLRFVEERLQGATNQGVIAVRAMESSPIEWYRAAIGPRVGRLDLEGLGTALYARAAIRVARRAPLTEVAATRLDADPASVYPMLQHELLSSTAVDRELIATLARIAPDARPHVIAAIEALLSTPRPARRWLEGDTLSPRESAASGLSVRIGSDREAADVLVTLAAIHRELEWPFILAIDELEHLVRFDEGEGSKSNVTWLKRLLERMEPEGACVFVAGHNSAWVGHPDFVERFSPDARILLGPLDAADVTHIVDRFLPSPGAFDERAARIVDRFCEGNIRLTLGMLHALFDRTDGFASPVTEDAVAETAETSARLDPEQAIDELGDALSRQGLRVARHAAFGGLAFDLIAYRDDQPAIVVEVKHALFGRKQQGQAQRFVDRLRFLNRSAPNCVGVFASSGAFEPALAELESGTARVFWFDLRRPEFVAEVERTVKPILLEQSSPSDKVAGSERDRALAWLEDQIQDIKEEQEPEYAHLHGRLEAPADDDSEIRFRSPRPSDTQDERRVLFEDLSARPPLLSQIGMIKDVVLIYLIMGIVLGLTGIALAIFGGEVFYGEPGQGVQFVLGVGGIVILSLVGLVLGRQLLLFERFFGFRRECLRDLYVLEGSKRTMIDAARVMDTELRAFGPRGGILSASKALAKRGLIDLGKDPPIEENW